MEGGVSGGAAGNRRRAGGAEKRRTWQHFVNPLLRLLQLAANVCAFVVMLTSGQGLSWRNYSAFRYLVAATVISGFWAGVMLLADCGLCMGGRTVHSLGYKYFVVIGDYIATIMSLTGGAAAAGVTTFNDKGSIPLQQAPCEGVTPFGSYCARTKAAVACSIIAAAFFIPSLVLDVWNIGAEYYQATF
ncbi:hypothetical protein CBR_g41166 [Chara braunii]|uniref:CASP-like protein n=1 Tax=Chara braunii TaxID=69332 RepID=A0A388K2J7_CHABU|nr:hypothetical protein CBR_g41166 [Chara braunii]|eukprot:GBG64245.1 hypothetical protein CBR_g41166 [Chara braunii]